MDSFGNHGGEAISEMIDSISPVSPSNCKTLANLHARAPGAMVLLSIQSLSGAAFDLEADAGFAI